MKLNPEMIRTIRETIDQNDLDFDYGFVGIRAQEEPFELGAIDHLSHIWVDGDDTEEELDGICATNVAQFERYFGANGEYFGDHLAIIVGNNATYGEDIGELIIKDAIVAAIIC